MSNRRKPPKSNKFTKYLLNPNIGKPKEKPAPAENTPEAKPALTRKEKHQQRRIKLGLEAE